VVFRQFADGRIAVIDYNLGSAYSLRDLYSSPFLQQTFSPGLKLHGIYGTYGITEAVSFQTRDLI
jgi:hypothetical protein